MKQGSDPADSSELFRREMDGVVSGGTAGRQHGADTVHFEIGVMLSVRTHDEELDTAVFPYLAVVFQGDSLYVSLCHFGEATRRYSGLYNSLYR